MTSEGVYSGTRVDGAHIPIFTQSGVGYIGTEAFCTRVDGAFIPILAVNRRDHTIDRFIA